MSSTLLQSIAAALNWNLRVTENFVSVSPAALYGINPATTTGLTFGYLGGEFNGATPATGTVALTASNTNYVVAHRTTGVVTAATTTTNWLNTTTYMPLYEIVAGASTITTITDKRQAFGGSAGGLTNPMTTTGDIIYSSSGSTPARLGVGSNTQVLTLAGGVPTWATPSSGFANPMTTIGDTIVGSTAGAPIRLANGTAGQVLKAVSGAPPAWANPVQCIPIASSDETTALTTGTAKVTFRMPYAFTLTAVRTSVTTAPTGGTLLTVDINEGGTTILSTKLTIDASEKTSTTAATPAVISDTSLADAAEITIDIDAVGSTIAGAGLKVYLIGYPT